MAGADYSGHTATFDTRCSSGSEVESVQNNRNSKASVDERARPLFLNYHQTDSIHNVSSAECPCNLLRKREVSRLHLSGNRTKIYLL